jgi:hypothetical protein
MPNQQACINAVVTWTNREDAMTYKLKLRSRDCLRDDEVEALRGRLLNRAHYYHWLDEDCIVIDKTVLDETQRVVARLVRGGLSKKLVTAQAESLRAVHGDLSNRGGIIYKDSMMYRESTSDGKLSPTQTVPRSMLELLRKRNHRLGLTGPYSDFLGFFDQTPRFRFCRETAWSFKRPDIFEMSKPLVEAVEYVNRHEAHDPWRRQRDFMRRVSQDYKYPDSIYSTLTINLNVRSCGHTDDGDFRGGMGNLIVLEWPRDDSGVLVMPRERVALVARPGDVLLMNVHHLHGNLPLTVGGTRLTAVLYAREGLDDCG